MPGSEIEANLRHGLLVFFMAATGMQRFGAELIAYVHAGGALDEDALATIKATAIRDVKNAHSEGMPIQKEAEAVGQAVQALEQFIDAAIREGRQGE